MTALWRPIWQWLADDDSSWHMPIGFAVGLTLLAVLLLTPFVLAGTYDHTECTSGTGIGVGPNGQVVAVTTYECHDKPQPATTQERIGR